MVPIRLHFQERGVCRWLFHLCDECIQREGGVAAEHLKNQPYHYLQRCPGPQAQIFVVTLLQAAGMVAQWLRTGRRGFEPPSRTKASKMVSNKYRPRSTPKPEHRQGRLYLKKTLLQAWCELYGNNQMIFTLATATTSSYFLLNEGKLAERTRLGQ
jgi:hypothetical protein